MPAYTSPEAISLAGLVPSPPVRCAVNRPGMQGYPIASPARVAADATGDRDRKTSRAGRLRGDQGCFAEEVVPQWLGR